MLSHHLFCEMMIMLRSFLRHERTGLEYWSTPIAWHSATERTNIQVDLYILCALDHLDDLSACVELTVSISTISSELRLF